MCTADPYSIRKVLFVISGIQTKLPEEKPTNGCVKNIDELAISDMPELEYVVVYDIVSNTHGCSNLVSEQKLKFASLVNIEHRSQTYRNLDHNK